MAEFHSPPPFSTPTPEDGDDDVDDVLRFLDLSPPPLPPPPPPPPPENELPEANLSMQDLTYWDFADEQASTSALVMVPSGDCAGGWAPPELPLDCRECLVLREIIHSNGLKNMRLSVHGTVGRFFHATLEVSYNAEGFSSAMQHSYIEEGKKPVQRLKKNLSQQSFEWVKQFLIDYGLLRARDKYATAHDSVSPFFDALCARMTHWDSGSPADQTGLGQFRPAAVNDGASRASKTGIAAQRERTGKLHIKDLANYFHLPISEAAKELRICSTALKKICRKHGMSRWPHRKIKSIDRRISNLLRDFCAEDGEEATSIQAEIEQLRAQRARICSGLPP